MPLAQCVKKGDLHAFDQALKKGEDEFVKRRIYLPLERAHDTCLRNLLRKVFIVGGFEEPKPEAPDAAPVRRTRVPVAEFTAAVSLSSKQHVDSDEVECQMANMIYKVSRCSAGHGMRLGYQNLPSFNLYSAEKGSIADTISSQGLMKGYIARERQIVVLSKKNDAFPGTGV